MKRNYDAFKTLAFVQYGIPSQVLEVVRPWIEEEHRAYLSSENINPNSTLGYAELANIITVEQAMNELKEIIFWQEIEGKRQYNKFIKDAGGRVGKGFYRYALKAYYLMGN